MKFTEAPHAELGASLGSPRGGTADALAHAREGSSEALMLIAIVEIVNVPSVIEISQRCQQSFSPTMPVSKYGELCGASSGRVILITTRICLL